MFSRKVRPLGFLRPEALRNEQGEPVEVNKFIADQAAMQLRLLGNADAERHRRYMNNSDIANQAREGLEHLDWVTVGILVSIPQPDAEQHFNRPNKFALLRRGPYQVLEVRPRTVTLVDYLRAKAGRNPESFQWPKYNLAPYYSMGDILPAADGVPQIPVEDVMLEPIQIHNPPVLPSVIIRAIPLDEAVINDRPNHVRNFTYEVRWTDRPHSANSVVAYDDVWSTPAFEEFVQGSALVGHIPPEQFEQHHLRQVQSILSGSRHPPRDVPLADAQSQAAVLRGYFPATSIPRIQAQGVRHASEMPPISLSQSQHVAPMFEEPSDEIQAVIGPEALPPRRSSRVPIQRSFGEDFVQ
jgi:hypothetical protein